MEISSKVVDQFKTVLPDVCRWIDDLLEAHAAEAVSVGSLGFSRLAELYPKRLLARAKVVRVDEVPVLPLGQLGLPYLDGAQGGPFIGMTFKDTFFVQKDHSSSVGLHFHEMVHVVQWAHLGVDNYLFAYGAGLLLCGYRCSPLEQMAYSLADNFELNSLPKRLVPHIKAQTDLIWNPLAAAFGKKGQGMA
jgi:hypothetical protein